MNPIIQDIKTKLNIKGGVFIDMEIEDYIKDIDPSKHLEFFKALSGGEFEYKNPMDRIAMVAKKFKAERMDTLLAGTREQAKAMYDKFYIESAYMLEHCTKNRDIIQNDRDFFRGIDYENLKKTDGSLVYTKQELYVLDYLGGGDWLMDIRFASNSKEVIDKIESVIKNAVVAKYGNQPMINLQVKKMISK